MSTGFLSAPRHAVGLELGDGHIAGAQIAFDAQGGIRLEAAEVHALPPEAGSEQLTESIRALFHRAHLARCPVHIAFQSPAMVVKHYHYPHLQHDDVPKALAIEAEETLQLSREALYFDWQANEPDAPGDGAPRDGVLVAAPRQEVERYLQMLARADVFPSVVDAGCLAVCNLFLSLRGPPPLESAVCVLALTTRRADIAILSRTRNVFPRSVFSPVASWADNEPYLTECVADTLRFHRLKLHGPAVETIVLTGTVPRRDLLVQQLLDLAPHVIFWNPVAEVGIAHPGLQPLAQKDAGAMLATCIGLALRRN
jgi:Tfp pilus assembly PilM family ATPase